MSLATGIGNNPTTHIATRGSSGADVNPPGSSRIPVMVHMGGNKLAHFHELRNDESDARVYGISVSISTNGGRTWSAQHTVYRRSDYTADVAWINMGGFGYDQVAGRMHGLITLADGSGGNPTSHAVYELHSDDANLETWSTPTSVASTTNPDADDWQIIGPHNIIKVDGGAFAGYMLAPCYMRETFGGTAFNAVLYLAPEGSWTLGAQSDRAVTINEGGSEAGLVEVRDTNGDGTGRFYLNSRIVKSPDNGRLHCIFTDPTAELLPDMAMMTDGAGNINSDATQGSCCADDNGDLLVMFPEANITRRNWGTVWRSTNAGSEANPTFTKLRDIPGWFGYSSFAALGSGNFCATYETEVNKEWTASVPNEQIAVVRFDRTWLESSLADEPIVLDYHFNEASSGTMSAMSLIYDHGNFASSHLQTKGCTGWTWGDGYLASAGTGTGLIWQSDSSAGSDLYGGPADWRNESASVGFCLYLPSGKSNGEYVLWDDRNDATTQGHTLKVSVSSGVYSIIAGWNDGTTGNQTHTLATAPQNKDFTLWEIRDRSATTWRLRADDGDGVFAGATATTDTNGNIIGLLKHTIGAQSGGNEKLAFRISHLKHIRGVAIADVDLYRLDNVAKETPAQLVGYNAPSVLPSSYDACILALAATHDKGWSVGTDYYTSALKGTFPPTSGQGVGAMRCAKRGTLYRQHSLGRNHQWVNTADAGLMMRPYTVAASVHRSSSEVDGTAAADAALNAIQNTGNFALCGIFRFDDDTAAATYILSNRLNGGSVPGIEWTYTLSTGKIQLQVRGVDSVGTAKQIINETGWTKDFTDGDYWYIGISGSASSWDDGDAGKLQLYWAQITGKTVGTMTKVTGSSTMSLSGNQDSTASFMVLGARNAATPLTIFSGAMKNVMAFNRPLTTAEHQELAEVAMRDGRGISSGGSNRMGLGIGIGL